MVGANNKTKQFEQEQGISTHDQLYLSASDMVLWEGTGEKMGIGKITLSNLKTLLFIYSGEK